MGLKKSSSTIRKWKSTDKWDDELKGSAPLKKNQNAMKHGLFSKWLPKETVE
ncbi:hypothetical protein CKN80_09560 [Carnobacterium divergens]|uniref:phage terminase small subunit-related protein n=1 Tax=Carnobacterium divergens TaxID=2748 RepID=UPI00107277DB|nr:phage terminase small subunit-related protein [Carnobacterium divergens]MPQ21234.1 hypothetical protein [Carnobacterium divergens]TFJ42814.1 hypothetical protein CKN79_09555 [Carnobacterium divergens]TFJ49967.1 hypothetical protein CKN80_09560 [Carnobacterium divergens]